MSSLVRLPGAVAAVVDSLEEVPAAVGSLELGGPRPVVAVVGGAGNLTGGSRLTAVFTDLLAPALRAHDAVAVDGGTDAGVMRLLGRARSGFPLVGVATRGTVTFPGHHGANPGAAPLEAHHSHFVLTPGDTWGDEAPYLAAVAGAIARDRPSVTVLINGGEIALSDAEHSLALGRPVLVLAGSGRAADTIAAAASDPAGCRDERLVAIAENPLVRVVDLTHRNEVAAGLAAFLSAHPA